MHYGRLDPYLGLTELTGIEKTGIQLNSVHKVCCGEKKQCHPEKLSLLWNLENFYTRYSCFPVLLMNDFNSYIIGLAGLTFYDTIGKKGTQRKRCCNYLHQRENYNIR